MKKTKKIQKVSQNLLTFVKERTITLEKYSKYAYEGKKSSKMSFQKQHNKLAEVDAEVDSVKMDLEQAQMDGLLLEDQGFYKAKTYTLCL